MAILVTEILVSGPGSLFLAISIGRAPYRIAKKSDRVADTDAFGLPTQTRRF